MPRAVVLAALGALESARRTETRRSIVGRAKWNATFLPSLESIVAVMARSTLALLASLAAAQSALAFSGFRPPAVPLLANDPFFSVWSANDNLYDGSTVSGPNGQTVAMGGIVRVDNVAYRFMGGAPGGGQTGVMTGIDIPGGDLPNMPVQLPSANWQLCQAMVRPGPHERPEEEVGKEEHGVQAQMEGEGGPAPRRKRKRLASRSSARAESFVYRACPWTAVLVRARQCNATAECIAWAYGIPKCDSYQVPNCWLKGAAYGPQIPQTCRVSQVLRASGQGLPLNTTATQLDVSVWPTQTVYQFQAGPVRLNVTFLTAHLPANIEVMARPVTYVTFSAASSDGQSHSVQTYLDVTAQLCTDNDAEAVAWTRPTSTPAGFDVLQMGAVDQQAMSSIGGSDRVHYGWVYLAKPSTNGPGLDDTVVQTASNARSTFIATGALPSSDWNVPNATALTGNPVLAAVFRGSVAAGGAALSLGTAVVAYEYPVAIEYFGHNFVPYWNRAGIGAPAMIAAAFAEWPTVQAQCAAKDANLTSQLLAAGGTNYMILGSLAYRQAYASTILVWNSVNNTMWQFLKEISSGSDLSTVDVIFPASPLYLRESPDLLWRLLTPLFEYANNATDIPYNLAWAPHHLGLYPVGNIEPSQQEQMPVEETGNLILMVAGIAQAMGNVDFVPAQYWPLIDSWGDYLWSTAYDPGNQLCTDDFEGPSPHNANLAAKGIVAMAAYAQLLVMRGSAYVPRANQFNTQVQNYTQYWMKMDADSSGDHYKLEYDLDNTWSTKYNLLWQKVLNLNVFPQSVFDTELKYYLTNQFHKYGVPLDNRADFAKTDWLMWMAAMQEQPAFDQITAVVLAMLNDTQNRVPLTDWYYTSTAIQTGFRCRAVVGGLFARLLVL